jgi:hypothetical protein
MPVNNRHTTPGQTQPRPPLLLPGQAEFGQHLKELARSGLRILLEDVMNEELTALLGANWGEHTRVTKATMPKPMKPPFGKKPACALCRSIKLIWNRTPWMSG